MFHGAVGQRHQTKYPGAYPLCEGPNGSSLACSVAAFKDDDDPLSRLFYPIPEYAKLGLQRKN